MQSIGVQSAFLSLVRLGIGKAEPEYAQRDFTSEVNWAEIYAMSQKHGLSAVVLDGINQLVAVTPELVSSLSLQQKLEWIGNVFHNYEDRYKKYENTIGNLAAFYNRHGYKMMVLKGYACSQDWPQPNHRPCGDIDIWQFGKQPEADTVITKGKGIKIDSSHHHHTVFEWNGFTVENHYDFINVHHHKSNKEFEKVLKEHGQDDSHFVEVGGEKVYLPSPNLHALFLLKHIMMHFAAEGIMLRQVLDWGFFVEKHSKEIEWAYVLEVLDKFGMRSMFNILNAICVGDIGFEVKVFPTVQFDPALKDRVLKEILYPQYDLIPPNGLLSRIVFKIKRWKANEWKHLLCYNDSMWSAFWSGVWNHLLKPSSI